jgi:gliding motility-associated-like protein
MTPVTCNGGADGQIEIINVTGGTAPFEYSNDGGATWQASPIFGGLVAATYNMQVRDANLCTSAIVPTDVTQPDAIAFVPVVNDNVTCNGDSDGEIEITNVTGGIAPYEYSNDNGATFQASPIFSGLPAGDYDMVVRDANLCVTASQQVTITEPDPITYDAAVNQNVTCNGGSDGIIEITNVLGGTAPYEYSIDNGSNWQVAAIFNGLPAGNYNVIVRDVNLCLSAVTPLTITEPDVVDFDTDMTPVTCNGGADGQIEVINVTGGTPGYEYSNDGGATWQAGAIFAGLAAGDYDIQVRDVNLCVSAIQIVTVTEPDPIDFDTNMTPVSCNGGNDGGIEVTNVTGGTAPYEYSNDGGATWQASPIFNLLIAGTYDIQVRDANLCLSAIVPVEVTQPDPIDFDPVRINVTCNGGSDGSIEFINVTGGTPAYEYSIDGGVTYQADPLFENLPIGNYNMIIRDANLCLSGVTPVVITQPDAITFDTNDTDISCNGGSDGEIEVINVLGGSGAGYEYSNDDGVTFQASNLFENLTAGTYNIVVRDGNGCLSPADPVTLIEPDAITYDTTLTNITCNGGGDGSIEVIDVLGGTPPYEYSIDNGANYQVAALFENLAVGTYDIVVRDANLCLSDVFTATLTEPDPIVVTLIDSLLSCGSLPVIDGNPLPLPDGLGVSYETTLNFTDFDDGQVLNAGDIESLYLDIEHSYPGDLIIELVAPDGGAVTLSNGRGGTRNLGYPVINDDPAVPGDGFVYTFDDNAPVLWTDITLEAHYYNGLPGPQPGDSLYIPSGTYVPENSFDGLAGTVMNGEWKLRVTDQFPVDNGFIFKWGIRFAESAYPANYCNGMLEVVATGGNGGFTYEWSNGENGAQITGLCADGYTVTVTDALGCSVEYTDSVYNVDIHMEVTDTTHVACAGEATGSATVLASGGNAPYSYDWSNGASGQTATNLTAGWYFITITDNNLCEHVDSLEIRSLYDLQLVFSDTVAITCNPVNMGDSTGGITVTPIGGSGNYTYTWSSTDGNDSVATALTAGWNYVTVTDDFCSAVDSVFLDAPAPIRFIETFHQDVLCNGDTTGATSIIVNNGAAPLTLEWDHIFDVDVYDLTNLGAGEYTATVQDVNLCMHDTTIVITEPAPFTYDVVVTPADCGTDNGVIEVQNILGGDGNYTVTWSHPDWTVDSVGLSITNLGVGNYTMMIQDGNLCDTIQIINMPDNSDISVSLVSKVDPTCATNCDGQATIEITGGQEPYTITWSNGTVDELSVNNLCDGPFTVLVVDDNGCSFELTDSVQAPDAIVMNGFVYTEPISCAGDSLAELYISAEGGTGELGYLWEDAEGTVVSADSILTNAIAGDRYYVTVTDANLCEYIDSIDITEMPDSILMAFTTQVTNCPEDSTGWAAVDVTGGVGPYSYNWYKSDDLAFPIVGFDTDSASSLAFGYYVVEVTDMLGCTVIDSVIIQSNTTLDFDVEVLEEVTCAGNGSARVTNIVNGVGPFGYEWSSGEQNDTAFMLNVGLNSVILTDSSSMCMVLKEFEMSDDFVFDVIVYELRPDYITGDDGNGLIRLEATGGVEPYTYEWAGEDGPIVDNDSLLPFLDAGWYYYTVTDALGCVVSDSAEIIETSIYIQDTIITNVSCYGYDNGAITIVPAGGIPPYTTYWNDGTWTVDSVGNTITNLVAGTYYLTITDLFSSYEDSLVVTEPQPYIYAVDSIPASCSGNDGRIIIDVESGGTEPFTYTWMYNGYPELGAEGLAWAWPSDTTVVNDTIENLHVGYYYFTMVDGGGCTTFDSVYLPDNSDFAIAPIALDPTCLIPGSISLNPNEFGAEPINYTWSHDAGLNNSVAAGLAGGDYAVTVIDDNLCVRGGEWTLTDPIEVDFDYEITQPLCSYDTTGTITITPFQGNGEYQYAVYPVGGSIDFQSNPVFTNLGAGQYTIRVMDIADCIEDKPALIESEVSEIVINELNEMPGCPTDTSGVLRIEVTEGLPFVPFTSLSYEWMIDSATLAAWGAPQEMYGQIISTDSVVTDVRPGVYNVKVTTASGCIEEQDITLLSDTSFVFDEINLNLVDTSIYGPFANLRLIDVCKYDEISLYAAPYAFKADPYEIISPDTVYWKSGTGLAGYGMSAGNIAFDTAIVNQSGTNIYTARIESGRCYMEKSVSVVVPSYPDVVAGIEEGEYTQVFENGRTVLVVNSITDSTYYSWTEYWEVTGETPPSPTLPDFADSTDITSFEVTMLQDTTIYTVVANTPAPYPVNNKYCSTTDTVKVRVMGEFNPPSAFSPNGDGVNDTWIIYGIDENFAFNLKIYNRWGQLVFESKDAGEMLYEGWDGTNMNGNDVTVGTYYYVIEYSDGTKTRKSNGPVTVIR